MGALANKSGKESIDFSKDLTGKDERKGRSRKPKFTKLRAQPEVSDEDSEPDSIIKATEMISRKRRFSEIEEDEPKEENKETTEQDKIQELKKTLEENNKKPMIPMSRARIIQAKRLNACRPESDAKVVDLSKARRKRDRARERGKAERREESISMSSSDSDSSLDSNTKMTVKERFEKGFSNEKGEFDSGLKDYLKDIIVPLMQKQREEVRKETITLLKEQGLINEEKAKEAENKDPFLEDEGFLHSDISGNTTPRRGASFQNQERKSSFKMAKTSSSQDRKIIGTPKRSQSTVDLSKQVIKPNKEVEVIANPVLLEPVKTNTFGKKENPEEPINILADMKKNERTKSKVTPFGIKDDKIESSKKSLFAAEKKDGDSKSVSKPLFAANPKFGEDSMLVKPKSETEEKEKKSLSIFGGSQDSVKELKESKKSNQSSPAFGEKKTATGSGNEEKSEKEQKPSLFAPKVTPIKETTEENQSNKEEKPLDSKPKTTLFSTTVKPISEEKKEQTPDSQAATSKIMSQASTNPFLTVKSGGAKNLFAGKGNKEAEKPKVSLFSAPGQSQGDKAPSLFSTKTTQPNLFKTESKAMAGMAKVPSANIIKEGSNADTEDVGMGGVTPPTRSPARQPENMPAQPKSIFGTVKVGGGNPTGMFGNQGSGMSRNQPIFPFSSNPFTSPSPVNSRFASSREQHPFKSKNNMFQLGQNAGSSNTGAFGQNKSTGQTHSLFSNQGNSGASKTTSTSLFNQDQKATNVFSMGVSNSSKGGMFGKPAGNTFGNPPSQGQPNMSRGGGGWNSDPFKNNQNKNSGKNRKDDGLFSDKARR